MMASTEPLVLPAVLEGRLPRIARAFGLLRDASAYARDLGRSPWDFAVELDSLLAAGVTKADLQWMVCKAYAEHALETTSASAGQRAFRPAANLRLSAAACFVLTPAGLRLAGLLPAATEGESVPATAAAPRPTPRWERDLHRLWLGSHLVKEFAQPAPNQEQLLTAFERLRWPARIADPLPPMPYQEPKERLRDTVKHLNRHQVHRLVRFHGDGTGRGVFWEAVG